MTVLTMMDCTYCHRSHEQVEAQDTPTPYLFMSENVCMRCFNERRREAKPTLESRVARLEAINSRSMAWQCAMCGTWGEGAEASLAHGKTCKAYEGRIM